MADLTARVDKPYVSSIAYMDQREILNKALNVTNEEACVVDMLELTGKKSITGVPEYVHHTNQYIFQSGIIDTAGIAATPNDGRLRSGTINDPATITITDIEGMPVVTEMVMFPSGRVGYVDTVTKGSLLFTVQPLSQDASDTLSPSTDYLADGDVCVFFATAAGEGSSAPQGRRPRWKQSKNNIQIFKTASPKVTDLQKPAKIEIDYNGKPHVMYKIQHETIMKHRAEIGYGFLNGKKAKFVDSSGDTVWMTQGLRNYIKYGDGEAGSTGGVVLPLGGSTITKADFRSTSRALDKKGAPAEYWLWQGGDLRADIDELMHGDANIKNGGILYNSFGSGDGKKRAFDLGVDSVRWYGRVWHMKTLKAFDHPEVFGAAGFPFGGTGFALPTGQIKVDKGDGTMERMCMRYMSGDGLELLHRETAVGGLLDRPTTDEATIKISYETVAGFEALGIDHFALIEK